MMKMSPIVDNDLLFYVVNSFKFHFSERFSPNSDSSQDLTV